MDASHVHGVPLVGVVPSFAPAASPRALRSSAHGLDEPIHSKLAELGVLPPRLPMHCFGPDQPGFEPLTDRGGSATGSLALHPSYLACPATASGCAAVPVRHQGCSCPTWQPPGQTALSFSQPLRRPGVGLSTHSDTPRLVTHDGTNRADAASVGAGSTAADAGSPRHPRGR
jgi:hypothetical protein